MTESELLPAPVVLASASPRRRDLLRDAGIAAEIIPADVEEDPPAPGIDPVALCERNAALKAEFVAARRPGRITLGADTLVALGDRILGKPSHLAEAREMLAALAGRTHRVVTGVCLCEALADRPDAPPRRHVFHAVSDVTFRPLDAAAIDRYLNLINPLDKAGAYAAQEHADIIIESIAGSRTNVIGLPMEMVRAELIRFRR